MNCSERGAVFTFLAVIALAMLMATRLVIVGAERLTLSGGPATWPTTPPAPVRKSSTSTYVVTGFHRDSAVVLSHGRLVGDGGVVGQKWSQPEAMASVESVKRRPSLMVRPALRTAMWPCRR